MRREKLGAVGLIGLALLAGACGSAASDSGAPGGGFGGSMAGGSGQSGGTSGGSSGSGGSGSSGTGGASGGTDAGASADGVFTLPDAAGDANAGADAGAGGGDVDGGAAGDAAPIPCAISLEPIAPARFTDIPAGEGRTLRIGAHATGSLVPAMPTWVWRISHASGLGITPTIVEGDPAVVEFPTLLEGLYKIEAEITGVVPACIGGPVNANAILPTRRVAQFRLLATPPQTLPAGKKLIPLETDVLVAAGTDATKTLELESGYPISIDPKDSEHGLGLPAYYVQITSKTSLGHVDGYIAVKPNERTAPFSALLDLRYRYDLLLVPDSADGGTLRAPLFLAGMTLPQFGLQDFKIDPGVGVSGKVSTAAGALAGTRLRLRNGALPSTVGTAAGDGAYNLRVRDGRFEVRVLPPENSGLPEALVPQSTGVLVAAASGDVALDFTYAPLPMVTLTLTVNTPEGVPSAAAVDVTLESLDGELSNVGTFALNGGGSLAASGVMRETATSAAGVVHFDKLPKARYRATLVPPADRPGDVALTTVSLDLTAATGTAAQTVALVKRGHLQGTLAPVDGGGARSIRALDSGPDGLRPSFTALVGTDGQFSLAVDPGRLYRLFLEPPTDRRGPRVPLDPVRATAGTVIVNPAVPASRTIAGKTMADGVALPGTLVQVYCLGDAPDCIDVGAVDVSNTPPIDETVSDASGRYTVYVPDPGR